MTFDEYNTLNLSYKKKLVYKWGVEAGFYSEVNNLILAMAYCLENEIQLVLNSPKQGINSIEKGWEDYFLPFCPIIPNTKKILSFLLYKFDYRQPVGLRKSRLMLAKMVKRFLGIDYFTFELWDKFRNTDYIYSKQNGGGVSYYRDLCLIAYRFTPELKEAVRKFNSSYKLNNYVGMHIRGGDKVQEYGLISYKNYFEVLRKQNTTTKEVFIFTDDYAIFKKCIEEYPEYKMYTTCKSDETGYNLFKLKKLSKEKFFEEYVKMIASLEILRNADLTIGTYTTNPSMFLGMIMNGTNGNARFLDVDGKNWCVT